MVIPAHTPNIILRPRPHQQILPRTDTRQLHDVVTECRLQFAGHAPQLPSSRHAKPPFCRGYSLIKENKANQKQIDTPPSSMTLEPLTYKRMKLKSLRLTDHAGEALPPSVSHSAGGLKRLKDTMFFFYKYVYVSNVIVYRDISNESICIF